MKGITSDLQCKSLWKSQKCGASVSPRLETEAPQEVCERVEEEMRSLKGIDTMIHEMKVETKKRSALLISGSRSNDGNTDAIVESIQDGLIDAGFRTKNVFLRDLVFSRCRDCGQCRSGKECQFTDDMTKLLKTFEESDIYVFSLHFDGQRVNGFMRKFVERLNFYRTDERLPRLKGKIALIVTTIEGEESSHVTKLVSDFYRKHLSSLGIGILDMLFFDGLALNGEIHERIDYLTRAYYVGRGLSLLLRKYYMKRGLGRRYVTSEKGARECMK